jgi:hypothetical protein
MSRISQDSLFESEEVVSAKIAEANTLRNTEADPKTIDFGTPSKRSMGL